MHADHVQGRCVNCLQQPSVDATSSHLTSCSIYRTVDAACLGFGRVYKPSVAASGLVVDALDCTSVPCRCSIYNTTRFFGCQDATSTLTPVVTSVNISDAVSDCIYSCCICCDNQMQNLSALPDAASIMYAKQLSRCCILTAEKSSSATDVASAEHRCSI